jgi:DMSO/TMAO reductase YedYZ molybdopterin-dependent catalytic subunit
MALAAPPGPFRPGFWRSPLRGPWLTAALGAILLVLLTVVAGTGFYSHLAYRPDLPGNAIVDPHRDLIPFALDLPTRPSWLYALTQGAHVTLGFVAVPVVAAKLWSVIPRLFAWPPFASPAQALERLGIALLVGSGLFELATGVVNAQVYYPFHFSFVIAHYYGAWLFTGALVLHVAVKLPVMGRAFRARGVVAPLRESLERTAPEPPDPDGLAPLHPAAPTISRRGLFGLVAGSSGLLALLTVGQAAGGPLRPLALLAPRRDGFPVNKTARTAGITPELVAGWRLDISGPRPLSLTRAQLLALPQRTATLPIACVEGWSTTQTWTGVPLAALARLAGAREGAALRAVSLQPHGALRHATLAPDQVADPRSLLALAVNGRALSLDHGYPARIIVPALPGVHNTKWVARLEVLDA